MSSIEFQNTTQVPEFRFRPFYGGGSGVSLLCGFVFFTTRCSMLSFGLFLFLMFLFLYPV